MDARVQAMFKRPRHENLSILTISQDYYDLSETTKRCNGKIYRHSNLSILRCSKSLSR